MGEYIKNKVLNFGKSDDEMKENMSEILFYIYNYFSLNYEKMKELYKDVEVPISFDDDDSDIHDYYRSKLRFICCYDKDDTYIYEFDNNNDVDIDSYENQSLINEIHNFLLNNSPKKLHIGDFKKITIVNERGINDDARGIRYLDWKLYFWNEFSIHKESGITLHDLIIAAYKTKSHKFEYGYEMYGGVVDLRVKDDCLRITTTFDHGS